MNDPNTGAAHNIVNAYGAAELQTRVSNHEQEVDNATASYQNNYRYYSQDHTFVSPTANGTVGDLIAVAIPMGQRYRLRIISTFAQLLISYDARIDILAHPDPNDRTTVRLMRRIQSAINGVGNNGVPPASSAFLNSQNAVEIILRPVLDAMVTTDHEFARTFVDEMINYFLTKVNRHNQRGFDNMENYLEYRIQDFGMSLWSTIIRYALCIPTLHQEVEDSLAPLTKAAFHSVILVDDSFGHDLDLRTTNSPVNALTVGAKLNPGMPFPAVKMAILRDVRTAQNMFKDAKTKWEQDHFGENDPSGIYARLYLQGLYDFVAGYHAWAETCPRYIVNTQG